ncbi:MAG: M23 family metallopeptidase [Clostridiales bacterium]|nr:M23 family metallopeptidase [Clostridiales bacterium]
MDTRYGDTGRRAESETHNLNALPNRRYDTYRRYGGRAIRPKPYVRKYGRGRDNAIDKNTGRTVRLLACLGIALITLLIKLIFPGASATMKREILPVLDSSVDYKAAFSSMGRFFTGDSDFSKAFNDMVAFLITGKEAIKAGAVPEGESVPVLGRSAVGAQTLGNPNIFPGSGQPLSQGAEIAVFEDNRSFAALQTTPAPHEPQEKNEVETFLESQSLFYGYDIPEDVIVEKIELPFEYIKPVDGILSSGFGYRVHPVDNEVKFHYGLDYDAPEGADILSFADGTVLVSGESSTLGYYLIVSHGDGFVTQYFHCKKLHVLSGDQVEKGMKIAEVGQTGNATGPCLHFEIIQNGSYLNPEYYLENEG